MNVKLGAIADVKMGLVLNRKKAELSSANKYSYSVVSLKSFNEQALYDHQHVDEFVSSEKIKDDFLVRNGDILLRLREPNHAVYIDDDYEGLIYPSLMVRIRVNDKRIDASFLAMYLNSTIVKRQLQGGALAGTQIPMIKLSDVNSIEICLPSLEKQKMIVEYSKLSSKELQLLRDLTEEKSKLSKQIFEKLVVIGE
jgi:restriction endonuclease S subunit